MDVGRKSRSRSFIACVVVLALAAIGVQTASAANSDAYGLYFSSGSAKSSPRTLNGATLSGSQYVFVSPSNENAVDRVTFSLGGRNVPGAQEGDSIDWYAPWDLMGGDNKNTKAFDFSQLQTGQHTITAKLKMYGHRSTITLNATFRVGTASTGSTSTTLHPTTTTVRPTTTTTVPTTNTTSRPTTTTVKPATTTTTVRPTTTVAPTTTIVRQPSTGAVKAFDSANTISDPNWFVQAYAQGYRLYVLQASNWDDCNAWPQAESQIGNAIAAGLKVGIYTRNPNCWQGGIAATGKYKNQIQFFAIDIESDPGIPVTRTMVNAIQAAGMRVVLYSGYGMWPEVMGGNVTSFSDLPLWDTNVTGKVTLNNWTASLSSPTPVQYGGWNTSSNMRIGVQQAFEVNLNGVMVDLNTFDAGFLR